MGLMMGDKDKEGMTMQEKGDDVGFKEESENEKRKRGAIKESDDVVLMGGCREKNRKGKMGIPGGQASGNGVTGVARTRVRPILQAE